MKRRGYSHQLEALALAIAAFMSAAGARAPARTERTPDDSVERIGAATIKRDRKNAKRRRDAATSTACDGMQDEREMA